MAAVAPTRQHQPACQLTCPCDELVDIATAAYCTSCREVKCGVCLVEEVDAYYCPNCLENLPVGEAMVFGNRCSKCFSCPSCSSALQTVADEREGFFFACSFCRWDSLRLGLRDEKPDVLVVQAVKRERDSPAAAALAGVLERAQKRDRDEAKRAEQARRLLRRGLSLGARPGAAASTARMGLADEGLALVTRFQPTSVMAIERKLQEREQEGRRWTQYGAGAVNDPIRYRYDGLALEREGVRSALSLVKGGALEAGKGSDSDEGPAVPVSKKSREEREAEARSKAEAELRAAAAARARAAAEAAEDAEEAARTRQRVLAATAGSITDPYRGFNVALEPAAACSLAQRLAAAEAAPQALADLFPARVPLLTRCKKRCRACAHIVIQAELKASSVVFEIAQFALAHVPVLRLVRPAAPLPVAGECEVVFSLTNALDCVVGIQLEGLSATAVDTAADAAATAAEHHGDANEARTHALARRPLSAGLQLNATVSFGAGGASHCDQAVELAEVHLYEAQPSPYRTADAPVLVARRVRNKVWLRGTVRVLVPRPDGAVSLGVAVTMTRRQGEAELRDRFVYLCSGLMHA